jgi:S-adenosylmethionine synthetase
MTDTPDLNQLTNLTNQQKTNTSGFLAGQNTQTADYLKRYTDFINSQEGASAMAGRIGGELGIPTLQANATMLRNTLTNLPSTYSKATTGYDVNANQLARIIGQKSSELAPAVTTAETSLSGAQNTLNTQMGYEQTDQAKALMPYQTEQTMLSDRMARETTLYSQDNQNELNSLIAKINAGITLSEGEKSRAQQLAIQEQSYNQAKETAKNTPNPTQVISQGGKQYLIDSTTGKIISTYGSGSSNTSAGSYLTTKSSTPSFFTPIG